MRRSGVVESGTGFAAGDHLCWAFDSPADLVGRATEFLADGLAHGERIVYVASGTCEELLADLEGLGPGLDELVALGTLQLVSVPDVYGVDEVVVPEVQVARYGALTEQALAEGYSGFRVAAEATPLVRTAEQLEAFCRYEHLVDRYMADHPFAALCAYDARTLPAETIGELAAMHPAGRDDLSPFRLSCLPGGDLRLEGEVDGLSAPLLRRALVQAGVDRCGSDRAGGVVVDASDLRFIDHRGLLVLDGTAGEAPLVLRGARPVVARLASLLELPGLRVEAAR